MSGMEPQQNIAAPDDPREGGQSPAQEAAAGTDETPPRAVASTDATVPVRVVRVAPAAAAAAAGSAATGSPGEPADDVGEPADDLGRERDPVRADEPSEGADAGEAGEGSEAVASDGGSEPGHASAPEAAIGNETGAPNPASASLYVKELVIANERPVAYGRSDGPAAPEARPGSGEAPGAAVATELAATTAPATITEPAATTEPAAAREPAPGAVPPASAPPQVTTGRTAEWSQIKGMFVDDPRASVARASLLVEDAIENLVDAVSGQQSSFASSSGDGYAAAETERLRMTLLGYRRLYDELAAMADRFPLA